MLCELDGFGFGEVVLGLGSLALVCLGIGWFAGFAFKWSLVSGLYSSDVGRQHLLGVALGEHGAC